MAFVELGLDEFLEIEHAGDDRFNFGVSGTASPVLRVRLSSNQSLLCNPDHLLAFDSGIEISANVPDNPGLATALNSEISNDPLDLHLASGGPGSIGAFNLQHYAGQIIIPDAAILVATPEVSIDRYFKFSTPGDHQGLPLELKMATGTGWIFTAARGEITLFQLQPGHRLCCRAQAVAAMTTTIDLERRVTGDAIDSKLLVDLTGPGKVWLQTDRSDRALPGESLKDDNLFGSTAQKIAS